MDRDAANCDRFTSNACHRIPMGCELQADAVVGVAVWAHPGVEAWLERWTVRFGYPTRDEAVVPDEGPRHPTSRPVASRRSQHQVQELIEGALLIVAKRLAMSEAVLAIQGERWIEH